ncbi:carboxymuconolactone decarboxylase family protein [Leuconostoc citreum]|uniref:carboxymuconolactone decarboxylase family protein n=1 Tax=Leuconostoc citreum TaxID=33964 RepID=UPI000BFEE8CE|nr:carboxymuconolactone decarboxylase family protein [Leuconostoc citreum]
MEKTERFEKGSKNLSAIDGLGGQAVIDSLAGLGEDIGKYIIEFAFGDIYDRKGLNLKQREMITITSLLSQGDTEPQLAVHINGSLNVGLTPEEIVETFIQCIPYVGFPKVLNALFVAQKVFSERKINSK